MNAPSGSQKEDHTLNRNHRKRVFVFFVGMVLLLGACIKDEGKEIISESVTDPVTIVDVGGSESRCGDGFCDGPENRDNCPADCLEGDLEGVIPSPSKPSPEIRALPPLYFFYAIHVHGSDENLPYTDTSRLNLNLQVAENMIAAVEDIGEILDRYGVKGTWEVLPATATGICSFQGKDHVFHQLIARGHEVGTHAHRIDDIQNSYWALENDCGITAKTTSGFIAQIGSYDTDEVQSAMSLSIQASLDLGMTTGTTNLSPGGGRNPFAELCSDQIGLDNDMWSRSGNLMFPWRPDVLHQDVCAHNDEGPLIFVDHVSIEWIKLPGQEGVPDVLTDQNFTQLRNWFNGALQYMQEEKPQRIAVWGFVTHITEFAIGSKAEYPLDPEALAALDHFLAYVDSKRMEGKIVYATVSEIADLVAINR
jgi:hypothetical protein